VAPLGHPRVRERIAAGQRQGDRPPLLGLDERAQHHAVFSRNFLGGDGDPDEYHYVTNGAFRRGRFRIRVQPKEPVLRDIATAPWIQRHFASFPGSESLPTAAEVTGALAVTGYDVAPFDNRAGRDRSFRARLEGFDLDASQVQSSRDTCADRWFTFTEGPRGNTHLHNYVAERPRLFPPPRQRRPNLGTLAGPPRRPHVQPVERRPVQRGELDDPAVQAAAPAEHAARDRGQPWPLGHPLRAAALASESARPASSALSPGELKRARPDVARAA